MLKWYIRCYDDEGTELYAYGPFKSHGEAEQYGTKTRLKDWDKGA